MRRAPPAAVLAGGDDRASVVTRDAERPSVPGPAPARAWFVYLVRCADGTYYAGSTTDVDARARAHNEGRGARYTSGRRPVEVVYRERCESKSAALKRECAVKRLTRPEKEVLATRS